jgi:hypothetical protein
MNIAQAIDCHLDPLAVLQLRMLGQSEEFLRE